MRQKLFVICMAAALLLAGCGGGSLASDGAVADSAPASSSLSGEGGYDSGWNWEMSAGGDSMPEAPESAAGSVYQSASTKLIRRAELNIETEQFDQSVAALNQLTADCGGYFEKASLYGGSRRDVNASRSGEYVVRVPAAQYDRFLSGAGDLGYVTGRDESSEDIGERYYDTETRLKTQRTKQERLLSLLERAETMEDIISLENALSDVEYQIEQYASELNRYDALVDFATFSVCLREVGRVTQEVGETASLGARMAAGFQTSVRNLGQGMQSFLVWVSYNLFLAAILAGVAVAAGIVGWREVKKLQKQKEADKTEK